MATEQVDVLIVGAGLSGIGAACHLKRECPNKSFVILEGRDTMGGTWDLFRYPGIRSDSDMYTLGYNFKPWTNPKAIADGPSILQYIKDTAREFNVEKSIRYGVKVVSADWDSETATWTVKGVRNSTGETVTYSANFMFSCTGYYNYEAGFTPDFPGRDQFKGQIIHPQHWPENLDYTGKRVVVIGSGATAVTLIPAMADKAAHITMLQRSPTYVASVPEKDVISNELRKYLPEKLVYRLARTRNIGFQMFIYNLCRQQPALMRKVLQGMVEKQLGGSADMKHFTPRYNPWEERLCAVPDGDLFKAIRNGKASVVTDHIETFTEKGIRLKSGQELEADIIVTATGLDLKLMGGMQLSVDGKPVVMSETMAYRALMFRDIPNLAMVFGYTNSSWTLKADISSEYVCRLLKRMDRTGMRQVTPRNNDPSITEAPFLDFNAGYVMRAMKKKIFPSQGNKAPWKLKQNYLFDLLNLRFSKLDDGCLEFSNPKRAKKSSATAATAKSAA
ncbi:MAG TPA: NAD(P)/FAD-dependent oxidoreductase [Pseudomonadales bacterium]|nr:NAD(P)/FAD-dependent oxidoreductase [Pseudomonadales bacterium]